MSKEKPPQEDKEYKLDFSRIPHDHQYIDDEGNLVEEIPGEQPILPSV